MADLKIIPKSLEGRAFLYAALFTGEGGLEILIRRDRIVGIADTMRTDYKRGLDGYIGPLVVVYADDHSWIVRGTLEEVARKLGLAE